MRRELFEKIRMYLKIILDDLYLVCSPTPCSNGAQCIVLNGNTDFYCICPTNLPVTGKRCDQLNLGGSTTPG